MSNRCIVIIYENPNQHVYTGLPGKRITLNPGRNEVSEADFLSLTKGKGASESLNLAIDSGIARVVRAESEIEGKKTIGKNGEVNISAMTVKDAKDIIENTFEAEALEAMAADELSERGRSGIADAIEKQLEVVNGGDDDDGGEG